MTSQSTIESSKMKSQKQVPLIITNWVDAHQICAMVRAMGHSGPRLDCAKVQTPSGHFLVIKSIEITPGYSHRRDTDVSLGEILDVVDDTLVVATATENVLVTVAELDGSKILPGNHDLYQLHPEMKLSNTDIDITDGVLDLKNKEEFWKSVMKDFDPTMMPIQKLMWKPVIGKAASGIKIRTDTIPFPNPTQLDDSFSKTEHTFAILIAFLGRVCCVANVQIGLLADKTDFPEQLQSLFNNINPSTFHVDFSGTLKENIENCATYLRKYKEGKAFLTDILHRYPELGNLKRRPFHNFVVGFGTDAPEHANDELYAHVLADAGILILLQENKMVILTDALSLRTTSKVIEVLKRFPIFVKSLCHHDESDPLLDVSLLTLNEINHYQCPEEDDQARRKEQDLLDDFWKSYDDHPESTALVSAGLQLTYKKLGNEVIRLAGILSKALPDVFKSGAQCLALHLPNSPGYVVSVLSAVSIKCPFLPLPVDVPSDRLAFVLNDARCSVMLTTLDIYEGDTLKELPKLTKLVHTNTIFGDLVLVKLQVIDKHTAKNSTDNNGHLKENTWSLDPNCCYIIYTSGSTGKPKGVQCKRSGVLNTAKAQIKLWDLGPDDVTAQFASIGFDAAISEIFTSLLSGGVLAVLKPKERLGKELVSTMAKLKATVVTFPPSLLNIYEPGDFPTLRKVVTAGEACTLSMAKRWGENSSVRFFNAYGPAENTVCATNFEFIPQVFQNSDTEELPIGKAIPGAHVYLFDEFQRPVPSGVVGEIYVGGKSLSAGYIGHAYSRNKERFVSNLLGRTELLYRTGDHAIRDVDGNLTFLGRLDNQVKLRGQMVNLNEVEHILLQHPTVDMAVVVKHQGSKTSDPFIAAFVSPSSLSIVELRDHLAKGLPKYMIPSVIKTIREEDFPLSPSGKVDRKKLEHDDCHLDEDSTNSDSSQFSETQLTVSKLWCKVLKLDVKYAYKMHKQSNFYDHGGNSLKLILLQKAIDKEFQVRLKFEEVSKALTIEELDNIIKQKQGFDKETPQATPTVQKVALREEIKSDAILELREIPKKVLLSGATGFLGAYLLYEILEQTNASVFCMVRESSGEKAYEKLVSNMRKYNLWQDGFEIRIAPVLSDLSKPKLGMTPVVYRDLSNCIDTVFMNAAKMNFNTDYNDHKDGNVDGTKEFIKFCIQGKKKYIFSTSSLSVFLFPPKTDNEHREIFKEDDMLDDPLLVVGGYGQSKWVAEQLVFQAFDKVPGGAIFRPARVSGDSQTGNGPKNDLFASMLMGIEKLGLVPDLDFPFDLTPVDFCAKAMVEIMTQICQDKTKTMPKMYHLFNRSTIPFKRMFDGMSSKVVSLNEWRSALWTLEDNDNPLVPLTQFFHTDFWDRVQDWPIFDTSNTDNYISDECRELLLPSQNLLKIYRNFFAEATPDEAMSQRRRRPTHSTQPV